MKRKAAFTLIELLVVVCIIGILAAVMGGAVSRSKGAARRIACVNNLKQWGQGAYMYTADNQERLPRESPQDGINTWEMTAAPLSEDVWYNALARVLGVSPAAKYAENPSSQQTFYSRDSIFHCPSAHFAPVAATYPNFSLAINSKLMMDFEATPIGVEAASRNECLRITQIKIPEKTVLFIDAGVPGEQRACEFQAPYFGQPKAFASEFSARHGRAGNILFAAGNVDAVRVEKVVDMDPNSPRRGGAIYPPKDVIWRHDPELVP